MLKFQRQKATNEQSGDRSPFRVPQSPRYKGLSPKKIASPNRIKSPLKLNGATPKKRGPKVGSHHRLTAG